VCFTHVPRWGEEERGGATRGGSTLLGLREST
jgi:hypothetical protein